LVNSKSSTLTWDSIQYPIFAMGVSFQDFYSEDNILFAKDDRGYRILDDRNLEGDTLGERRLQLRATVQEVYPLYRAINTFVDLIKYSSHYKYYIDKKGVPFKYHKTNYVPLKYKPISFKKSVEGSGTMFMVKGVHSWFQVPGSLPLDITWAGLLYIDASWVLYDLVKEKKKDSRRKV